MNKLKLFILHGPSRENNRSLKAAKYLSKIAEKRPELEVTLKSVADFNVSDQGTNEDNKHEDYTKLVEEMDAMIIVSPEYNHSFSGSLKRLLDSEYQAYSQKPVSLVGVSTGRFSGVRAVEQLVLVTRELGLVNIKDSVYIGKIKETVAEDGQEADEFVAKSVDRNLDLLIWYAQALKWGRDNI